MCQILCCITNHLKTQWFKITTIYHFSLSLFKWPFLDFFNNVMATPRGGNRSRKFSYGVGRFSECLSYIPSLKGSWKARPDSGKEERDITPATRVRAGGGDQWWSSLEITTEDIWYQNFHLKHRLYALLKMFKIYKWTDGRLSYKSNLCALDRRVVFVRRRISKCTAVLLCGGKHPEFKSQ